MRTYVFAELASPAYVAAQASLARCGIEVVGDVANADSIVVAVAPGDAATLAVKMNEVRALSSVGIVAMVDAACTQDDWCMVWTAAPMAVSSAASADELVSALSASLEVRQRFELSFAGERRLELLRRSLEEVSMIDMRTGMYNRRFLITRLREALAAARRYGRPLTLCLFRIVDFELLESMDDDDELLTWVESLTDLLDARKRSADIQAWITKDEFALLLPETPVEGAQIVADRVVSMAAELSRSQGVDISLVASVSTPLDGEVVAEEFLERARKSMNS